MTRRAIVYDISGLVTRIFNRTPNGIDRVDFSLARHFLFSGGESRSGAVMTPFGLRVLAPQAAREAVNNIRRHWREDAAPDEDALLGAVVAALKEPPGAPQRFSGRRSGQYADAFAWLRRHGAPLGRTPRAFLDQGGAYLNVSQFRIEFDSAMRWLAACPQVDGVFFIHDLLPLETPEYFRASEAQRHARRIANLARYGRAAIVSSDVVGQGLARRLAALGRADMPILVAPLPADPIFAAPQSDAPDLAGQPYFVMCGTLEPRKNHLLVMHVWRDLVDRLGAAAPKLVLIGERGWENEHLLDLLERCPRLSGRVIEVSGLATPSLKRLLSQARALLMPSFAEGYGLPLIEALSAGVPVIASDIPVFREISGGRVVVLDPTDGPAWRDAISAFMPAQAPQRQAALARLDGFAGPNWPDFFDRIEGFLDRVAAGAATDGPLRRVT